MTFFCLCITLIIVLVVLYYILDGFLRVFKVGNYPDKAVLITGCDTGFGKALAIRLDNLGFMVFASCLTEEGRQSIANACSSRLTAFILDITDEKNRLAALETIVSKLPMEKGLWAFVNNAGIVNKFNVPTEAYPLREHRKIFEVNFFGPVEMIRLLLPLVRKAQGRIVLMASINGLNPCGFSPYVGSKFALRGYGILLRREMLLKGVKVSILQPGMFLTNLASNVETNDELLGQMDVSPEVRETYQEEIKRGLDFRKITEMFGAKELSPVIDAYTHAVCATYPRSTYVVGPDARFFLRPLLYVPDWVSDKIINFFVNFDLNRVVD